MEKGLLIFVQNPENGIVKPEIAADLGAEKTLQVYNYLLQNTSEITIDLHCNHFVFYSRYVHVNDVFDDGCYTKFLQEGTTLTERIQHAFTKVFALGCKKVCLIFADYYELKQETIEDAFDALDRVDVVAGPAADRDFYLLGLRSERVDLLNTGVSFEEGRTLNEFIDKVNQSGFSSFLLPELNDVDTYEELSKTDIITRIKEDLAD